MMAEIDDEPGRERFILALFCFDLFECSDLDLILWMFFCFLMR